MHAPLYEVTRKMVTDQHLELMKTGATFVNTARRARRPRRAGEVLSRRLGLQAVLDATEPEPLPLKGHVLINLPNAMLTPRIAGSLGAECQCLGELVLANCAVRWPESYFAARVYPTTLPIAAQL